MKDESGPGMKRRHRDLPVWQSAMNLVSAVYQLTSGFPSEERFGVTAQMRRAAVSNPSNIAEGAARSGTRELLNFLAIAAASVSELDTQLEIARRLGMSPLKGALWNNSITLASN